MRNVELTKQRILEAATREFSDHGFHGARVDRIARNASANKALIYSYFGNKEALFAAVYLDILGQVVQDVPMDAADLPGYLARRLEWQFRNPALSRIVLWGTLELGDFPEIAGAATIRARKLEQIANAQQAGVVSNAFTPEEVLELIDRLAGPTRWLGSGDTANRDDFEQYKHLVIAALKQLVAGE